MGGKMESLRVVYAEEDEDGREEGVEGAGAAAWVSRAISRQRAVVAAVLLLLLLLPFSTEKVVVVAWRRNKEGREGRREEGGMTKA